jgi:hypothetical protein
MSRGPGRVQRGLERVFDHATTEDLFTTAELCRLVFGVKRVQKKHRVSLLRAIKSFAARKRTEFGTQYDLWCWRRFDRREDDVWFKLDHLRYETPRKGPYVQVGIERRAKK